MGLGRDLSVAVHMDLSGEVFGLGSLLEDSHRSGCVVAPEIAHDSHRIRAVEDDRIRLLVGSHGEVVVSADDSCD